MAPERRVSRPTRKVSEGRCRAVARPIASASSGVTSTFARPLIPSVPKRTPTNGSALGALRRLASLLQAVLLALFLARITSEQAGLFQAWTKLRIELDEASRNAEAKCSGLSGDPATVDGGIDVETLGAIRDPQWLSGVLASRRRGEVLLEGSLVDRDGSLAFAKTDPRDCRLASTSCLYEWLWHCCSS